MISKFSYKFTFVFKSKFLKRPTKKFIKGKFSVAVRERKVNEKDHILFESIFLKILKIIIATNAGKKQKPRKRLSMLEIKILFK